MCKSLINLAALIAKDGKIIKGLVILHAGFFSVRAEDASGRCDRMTERETEHC